MTLKRVARCLTLGLAAGAAYLAFLAPAQAVPVFARQTGHNCQACHISYPELTAYGREFKLNGYTFGEAQPVPLAFAIMAEYTKPSDNQDHGGGQLCNSVGASCSNGQIAQWSLFAGGRVTEELGAFIQYSSNQFILVNGGITGSQDNTEFRYAHRFSTGKSTMEDDSVVGLIFNNNVTMQDVWHSASAWRFPWFPYNAVSFGPKAGALISSDALGHRAVGLGAYTWIQKNWYAELSLYKSPWSGPFSWMVNGNGGYNSGAATAGSNGMNPSDLIDRYAPYYRLAYSRDWGYHSFEVGVFGMHSKLYYDPNQPDTANIEEYRDTVVDVQYQFNKNEPWVYTTSASWTHESNSNSPQMVADGLATNSGNTVNEFHIRGTAYYDRTYGVTLAYSSISGSSDPALYGSLTLNPTSNSGNSATGDPKTNYWELELNYLPLQDMRFSLYYLKYGKLNGGNSNFDGMGNNASGQNTIAAAIWWIF